MKGFINNLNSDIFWVWATIFTLLLLFLIITVLVYCIKYKERLNLNVKTLVKLSTYLAMYLVIGFISNIFGEIHIVFDYIVPVAVGFIYGPLIGLFFGFVGYLTKSLLFGNALWLLPMLFVPIIGVVSGWMGLVWKEGWINEKYSFIIFQSAIISLLVVMTLLAIPALLNNNEFDKVSTFVLFNYINILLIELVYLIFISKSENKKDTLLFTLIILTVIIVRTFDLLITPFNGYFIGKYPIYWISLLDYSFRSGYMIVIQGLGAYFLIKAIIEVESTLGSGKDDVLVEEEIKVEEEAKVDEVKK